MMQLYKNIVIDHHWSKFSALNKFDIQLIYKKKSLPSSIKYN